MKTSNIQNRIYRRAVPIIYYSIVAIMIGMIVYNISTFGERDTNFGLGRYQSFENAWVDAQGKPFNFKDPSACLNVKEDEISAFHKIDPQLQEQISIVFRTRNAAVKVFVGDKMIYMTDCVDGPFNNRSPGIRWNVINVDGKDAGKTIQIRMKLTYQADRSMIDKIYIGDRAMIILDLIDQKGTSMLLCFLMFVAGVLYYIAGVVLNYNQKKKDYSLMFLASYATISAVWCSIETNLLQFFFDNIRVLQVIDNMMLVIGAMPLFLYMDGLYGIFKYRVIRILCITDLVYMSISTVCHAFGWYDYHQTLSGMCIGYLCMVVILVFCIIRQAIVMRGQTLTRQKRISHIMQQLGMAFLAICTASDLYRYITQDCVDRATCIRVGLVIFILFFGLGNIYRLIELVKQGLQTELIHRLAYTDGLTGVGNRTAYTEHLDRIVNEPSAEVYGIVIFDVNDLKAVNDEHGHTAGDYLIKSCAEQIKESFLNVGKLYRIGGDEFAVILTGANAYALYELAIEELQRRIHHKRGISIAYGASFSNEPTQEGLHLIQMEADQRMYEHKKKYKNNKDANLDDKSVIC